VRISLLIGLGPLEENETTRGATVSFPSMLFNMVAVGFLESSVVAYQKLSRILNVVIYGKNKKKINTR